MERLAPYTLPDLAALVGEAAAHKRRLHLVGRGTKAGLGHVVQADAVLDLSGFAGIEVYEPDEQIITLGAGTPLATLEAVLARHNQRLAFEPPDLGPLYGEPAGLGTIGGVIAANLSGPPRPRAGAARDHLLGVDGVTGRGEIFKAGGRVVKNVTGYDLPKLVAGSYGTLFAVTRLTLRLAGQATASVSVLLLDLDPLAAGGLMQEIAGSALEPVAIAYLPADVAVHAGHPQAAATVLVRFDGPPDALDERIADLEALVGARAPVELVEDPVSAELWKSVRDVADLLNGNERAIWRLVVPPAAGTPLAADLCGKLHGCHWFADWAGGRLWLAVPPTGDAGAAAIRAATARAGGHSTLMRGPAALRQQVPVFEPLSPARAALDARVREAFDPAGVFNPGKLG
ncbi:FAD-binding protein [Oleomonas cavernae]|uniref:FAD-binding protein n=1 Tax=Oleomonas cavernae TaxID=2320859 RepID=A0A418WJE0_9PROT|nr:FAD-binding protein [Oleomonas cavernae]RJF90052.1 FAD-binding protein [Oleomonas cavernae]